MTDQEVAFMGGVMFSAGSGTTTNSIISLIMAMINFPDAQRKAQEELDRVVGRGRMPTFADMPDLPYIVACAREIQRFRPAIPGGLPHASTSDDFYMGYFIPAGTVIVPNSYAIHKDPALYPDPDRYYPDRFLEDGKLVGTALSERGHFGFGYGRRVCPGLYIAERTLQIACARVLWAFDLRHAKAADGSVVPVPLNDYTTGFSAHPRQFRCSITPRHADVSSISHALAEQLGVVR